MTVIMDQVYHSGYLRKQSSNISRDWQRRYFVLTADSLSYLHHDSEKEAKCRIPLISMSLRLLSETEKLASRRFKLLTPSRDYLLEAETEEEARLWIIKLQEVIERHLLDTSSRPTLLTTCVSKRIIEELLVISGNGNCADCGVSNPTWTAINLGILLCIDCSGIHRSLGCQVSKVRSLEFDSFPEEIVELLITLGNTRMNAIWEVEDYLHQKFLSNTSQDERRSYITEKYVNRSFTGQTNTASPITAPRSLATFFSPEMQLFETIQGPDVYKSAQFLFRFGVELNVKNGNTGASLLHVSAAAGQLLQTHFLLLNGANALAVDDQNRTPRDVATGAGFVEIAELLLRHERIFEKGKNLDCMHEAEIASRIQKGLQLS